MAIQLGKICPRRQADGMDETQTQDAKEYWEQRYGERDRLWSGRVNARLAEIVAPMTPGTALDLGCGEGGDAVWLAEHGWRVIAVDISETALGRGAAAAADRGLSERIEFLQFDLADGFPAGTFDLVSAQFLHSTLPLDRTRILRDAARTIRAGGWLVIVDHGEAPPWASEEHRKHHFQSAEDVIESLDLDESDWERVRFGASERQATGPDGQPGTLIDNVVVLRRR
jgi:SAM-dependent methyltransferase